MPGLPFESLPGTQAGSYMRAARPLGNSQTGKIESVPFNTPIPMPKRAPGPDGFDPFAALDQIHQARVAQVTPLFDTHTQALRSQVDQTKNDLYKQYLVEAEGLGKMGLTRDQIERRNEQLKVKYKLAFTRKASEVEPALQELDVKRKEAVIELEARTAEQRIRLQQIQEMVDKGVLTDPAVIRQQQLDIIGYNVPLSTLRPDEGQRPTQRLGELRPIYNDLLKRSAQYKEYPNGWRVFDEAAHDASPRGNPDKWYHTKATPEQAAEAEDIHQQLREVGDQIKELNQVVGRRPSLVEATASPIGDAVKAAKLADTVMSVTRRYWPLASSGGTRVVGGRTFKQVGPDQWVPVE